jgi:hypothetical protein
MSPTRIATTVVTVTAGLVVSIAPAWAEEPAPVPGEPSCHGLWVANAAQEWKEIGGFDPGWGAHVKATGLSSKELHDTVRLDCR